ncbi:MAG: HD-GYP domain-containing protein [Actinomycetota bacterium]|nr:HD-GYP domain-containing protein [Actinomycetota bacterium]
MSTRPSIGLYLRHSILATLLVVGLPLVVAAVVAVSVRTASALAAGVVVATLMGAVVASLGTLWWRKRPESVDLCFNELMLWGFWRRRRAELRLEEGTRILGLDRRGRPLRRAQISKADRVKILHDLTTALEAKDPYTHGHSTRVEHLATKTAHRLGMKGDEVETLKLAASLHDVGKIRVPSRVLRKPGRLTEDERSIVQEHSVVGAWMVSRGVQNPVVVESIRHHHERWDGRGYPDGLEGSTIPMFSRIIAVVDAYDAMTSTRPYRSSLDRSEALQELRVEAGNQFDPIVVDAFLELEARRSPVAGFLAFGGFYKLLRRAFSWSARTTSTGVGPVVGAVGASSLLIAGMMGAPAGSPPVISQQATPSQEIESLESGTDPGPLSELRSADKALLKRRNFGPSAAEAGLAEAHKKEGDRTPGTKDGRGDNGDSDDGDKRSNGSDQDDKEPKDPAPTVKPDKPAKPDKPEPPAPPPPPDTGKVKSAHTDPQPDKGRDCIDHPGKGQGGGNAKHCG